MMGMELLFIVRPEHQAGIAHTAIKNYALVKTALFANLNGLGARAELSRRATRGALRPRLGLAWPG